jgi:CHAT domain-containing protein/tetratricopeptide (TPR) repeat protein
MKNRSIYLTTFLLPIAALWSAPAHSLTTTNFTLNSAPTNSVKIAANSTLQSAQALNQQGAKYLAAGQAELALKSWKQAYNLYSQAQDPAGIIGSQINQAQALQSLGFYQQSLLLLRSINSSLQQQPNSSLKAQGLLSLGNGLRGLRQLEKKNEKPDTPLGAKEVLKQALSIANAVQDSSTAAQIKLSLGNTLQLLGTEQSAMAIETYRELATATDPLLKVQAEINLYRLESAEGSAANTQEFITTIRKELDVLPASRQTAHAYINLAETIKKNKSDALTDKDSLLQVAKLLTTAIEQAKTIKDDRSTIQALDALANLYERNAQYPAAQDLTQQALVLAENLPAPDLAYRLHWQMGRVLAAQNRDTSSIAAYRQAISHLGSLRNDLAALDADVQFSFRNSVEPVYRELVSLLLKDEEKTPVVNLSDARDLIEALQVAELQSFLRQGCLDNDPNLGNRTVQIDQIDKTAAVIYPIVLPDRVAVIAVLPQQPLRYYSQTTKVSAETLLANVTKLRAKVEEVDFTPQQEKAFNRQSKQIYDQIIAPMVTDLQRTKPQTLVFVLDGALRNMPMSALYDGKQYLVEKYKLALTPGLRLLPPKGFADKGKLQVFAGGITEARQGFVSLPGVKPEIESINRLIPNKSLVNADFNDSLVGNNLVNNNSQIVHLATHGQFSSNADETFLLTWDNRIDLGKLNSLIKDRSSQSDKAIDLLVLSACQTAIGDDRATLGLAGVAVRAGARSTIASLWSVSDEATQLLMSNLYQKLVATNLGKAESLQTAQQSLLRTTKYRAPFYWAPFILVGNWQ